jgi:hypothetical protein
MSVLLPDVHLKGMHPIGLHLQACISWACIFHVHIRGSHHTKSDSATGCNQRIFLKDRLDCVPDDRHVRVDMSSE